MKSFLISFVFIVAVVSAAKWLLNDGEMRKITAFFCSLVLIFSLFSGENVSKIPSFNYKTADFESQIASFSNQNDMICACSEPIIEAVLTENGINYSKIELNADKLSDNSIIINKVSVYSDYSDTEKIKDVLLEHTTAESVEVISD